MARRLFEKKLMLRCQRWARRQGAKGTRAMCRVSGSVTTAGLRFDSDVVNDSRDRPELW